MMRCGTVKHSYRSARGTAGDGGACGFRAHCCAVVAGPSAMCCGVGKAGACGGGVPRATSRFASSSNLLHPPGRALRACRSGVKPPLELDAVPAAAAGSDRRLGLRRRLLLLLLRRRRSRHLCSRNCIHWLGRRRLGLHGAAANGPSLSQLLDKHSDGIVHHLQGGWEWKEVKFDGCLVVIAWLCLLLVAAVLGTGRVARKQGTWLALAQGQPAQQDAARRAAPAACEATAPGRVHTPPHW